MQRPPFLEKILDTIAKKSTFNTANVLILLTSAGWLASSLAQIVGIYFNKNYTKEEKSFMIPQELADAMVNIGSFLLVTKSLKALTTHMVETGKIAPKSICKFLESKGLASCRGQYDFNVSRVEGFQRYMQTYNTFKTTAESVAAIVGGILSSNIITPILRNKIASKRKDSVLESMGGSDKPVLTEQPVVTNNTGRINTKRHTFEDFRSGALRI